MASRDFSNVEDWLHLDKLQEDFSTGEEPTSAEEATNTLAELYGDNTVPHPQQPYFTTDILNSLPPSLENVATDRPATPSGPLLPFLYPGLEATEAPTFASLYAPSQPTRAYTNWYPEGDIGRAMAMYDIATAGRRRARMLQRRSYTTVDQEPGPSTMRLRSPAPSFAADTGASHADVQEVPATMSPLHLEQRPAREEDQEHHPVITVTTTVSHAEVPVNDVHAPVTRQGRKRARATRAPVAGPSTTIPQDATTDEEDSEPAPKRACTAQRARRTRQELEEDQREDYEAQECGVDGCHWALAGTSTAAQRQHMRQAHYPSEMGRALDTESTASSSSGCVADAEDTTEDESTGNGPSAHSLRCRHVECDKGDLEYRRRQDLIRHIESAHWRPKFVCKCGAFFRRRSLLTRHAKGCSGKKGGNKKKPRKGKE